ncbi:MAG: hypothetical protein AAFX85_11405, partial [Pseudomonadota bacterium]
GGISVAVEGLGNVIADNKINFLISTESGLTVDASQGDVIEVDGDVTPANMVAQLTLVADAVQSDGGVVSAGTLSLITDAIDGLQTAAQSDGGELTLALAGLTAATSGPSTTLTHTLGDLDLSGDASTLGLTVNAGSLTSTDLSVTGDANLNVVGDITLGPSALLDASDLTLGAVNATQINFTNLDVSATGKVQIVDQDGAQIGTGTANNGFLYIASQGDIVIGQIDSGVGMADLRALDGSISRLPNTGGAGNPNVISRGSENVVLYATGTVGQGGSLAVELSIDALVAVLSRPNSSINPVAFEGGFAPPGVEVARFNAVGEVLSFTGETVPPANQQNAAAAALAGSAVFQLDTDDIVLIDGGIRIVDEVNGGVLTPCGFEDEGAPCAEASDGANAQQALNDVPGVAPAPGALLLR